MLANVIADICIHYCSYTYITLVVFDGNKAYMKYVHSSVDLLRFSVLCIILDYTNTCKRDTGGKLYFILCAWYVPVLVISVNINNLPLSLLNYICTCIIHSAI
jgi:hypothetical protein